MTLVELVNESNKPFPEIVLKLSMNNLLKQYEYESTTNEYVKPSLTLNEFKKIIGD
jgi:hypothetical protein